MRSEQMKRLLDFLISLLASIVLFIPMLIVGIIVRIKIGSPIIFKQKRPGYKGKPFYIYKFRTMTNETDEHGELLEDEKRITEAGKIIRKYSLDELPQLFNVLKGDLSLVGPRPLAMEYLPLYNNEQAKRHDVRPGITGWAQVNGRNAISWEERFFLDVWYVKNQSILLDTKILFLTGLKVLKSDGVTPENKQFFDSFKGTSEKNNG